MPASDKYASKNEPCLKHQRIIANAGSGKTYRLATRYIELLERGVPAERIVALTFTRKAAGEFLDAIFNRLVEASSSAETARTLGAETRSGGLSAAGCLAHLRQLVEKLPLLTLGTLDSFLGRILRAFSVECGLAGEVAILEDNLQTVLRRQVLAGVFREEGRSDEGFSAFLELIRKKNRNREGRNISGILDREIENLHERFLLTPGGTSWGDPSTIWPQERPVLDAAKFSGLARAFEQELFRIYPEMDQNDRGKWEALFQEARALFRGSPTSGTLMRFASQAIRLFPGETGPDRFSLKGPDRRERLFPAALRRMVAALGFAIMQAELEGRLERSRALYDLMARFETRYQAEVRDAGQLTFLDVAGLLAAAGGTRWGTKTLQPFTRQEMDFRLDSSYDHWLLDEFQDTSRLQWKALRDLVDEVIQSDSGQRSFFYVGDTKQAIYSWRGGDPRLFDEIADFYNASGTERIDTSEALEVSFRSVPEIVEAVNAIFSPPHLEQIAQQFDYPQQAIDRWKSAWHEHKPHRPARNCGWFEWRPLEIPSGEAKALLDEEAARLIADIDPISKGLSCAVLVRSNARIVTVIDALRRVGLSATSEGRFFPCQDNDFATAMLALLNVVAHPDDSLSLGHVRMTPLRAFLEEGVTKFRVSALKRIRETGFGGALSHWVAKAGLEAKPFAGNRAEELIKAGNSFDATWRGPLGVDEFLSFAQGVISSEDPAEASIRVLTIHAAKGLDFDMVVLPDLAPPSFNSRQEMYLHYEPDGQVRWGLELPPKEVCLADPVLRQAWENEVAERCYESLCLSYVAVTRARRALYLLSRKPNSLRTQASKDYRDFRRLLQGTFSPDGARSGDPAWHEKLGRKRPVETARRILSLGGKRKGAASALLPSKAAAPPIPAASFFGETSSLASGTEVHRALAGISWFDDPVPDFEGLPENVRPQLAAFLDTQIARRLFTRPATPHLLWREKAFDVILDGQWISGVFDRVVIYCTDGGKARRAAIYDFKTDEGELVAKTYRTQMGLYRKALASLAGLEETHVTSSLISVRGGKEVPIFEADLVQGLFDLV